MKQVAILYVAAEGDGETRRSLLHRLPCASAAIQLCLRVLDQGFRGGVLLCILVLTALLAEVSDAA